MGLLDLFSKTPSEAKYVETILARLRDADFPFPCEYDASESVVRLSKDGEPHGAFNVTNLYAEFCTLPKKDRKEHLDHVVQQFFTIGFEVPEDFEDAKPDILPSVRTQSYYDLNRLMCLIEQQEPLTWPRQEISEHLAISLVYDMPGSMRAVTQEDLDTWNVTFYEALEVAKHNLQEREFAFASIGDSFYGSATGDSYDATRMMLLDTIRKFEVKGDYIAMACNRDSLYITGSDDHVGQGMMLELAEKTLEEPRPMHWFVHRLVGDNWEWWRPPEDNPHYRAFRSLEVQSWLQEYSAQKEVLDQLVEQEENAPFVATYMATQNEESGEVASLGTWAPIPTWLPQTDRVAFVYSEGNDEDSEIVAMATWERVQEVVGHRMKSLDYYPPRFEVTDFPTKDEISQLGMMED